MRRIIGEEHPVYLRNNSRIHKASFSSQPGSNAFTATGAKKENAKRKSTCKCMLSGFFYIFHPATLSILVMAGIMGCYLYHLPTNISRNRTAIKLTNKSATAKPLKVGGEKVANETALNYTATINKILQTRVKRSDEHDDEGEGRSAQSDDDDDTKSSKVKRKIPKTPLDDMLLDAEMPASPMYCLTDKTLKLLEDQEKHARLTTPVLSEHLEKCTSNDDCMQLSPFHWKTEGSDEVCRKRTFLSCNFTGEQCVCQDRFDLRWDTEVTQSTYQWNPITKTCYVRASNPCKMEIPCAPGTTCRATVSISYNVPPLERICDCTDINLIVRGFNDNWWYCAEYWQKTWVFDLDNINKWKHPSYHIFARMKQQENQNAAETEADYLRR